jgi:hypothetical protein
MKHLSIIALIIAVSCLGFVLWDKPVQNLEGYNTYDTYQTGVTHATTSIGVYTPVQVFSSISKWGYMSNNTVNTITCALDDLGTTVASSTVSDGIGIIIGANATSTINSMIPSVAQFGECPTGAYNCYPFKGTVNCIADATSTITYTSK